MADPYYEDRSVTIYHGDMREILPCLPLVESSVAIADPPYGQTSLAWDRWPEGWPNYVPAVVQSLWCFGSLRMFLDRVAEFTDWKLAQDIVWEKHNGSSFHADRFKRVHEQAAQFYRGAWADVYRSPVTTPDATKRTVRRKKGPPHTGHIGAGHYVSQDGGPRLQRSVIRVRSCHGHAENETQKPEGIVLPLIEYSVPPGGLVLDLFTGSGTVARAAKETGRRCIAFDVREDQCEIAARRCSQEVLALDHVGIRASVGGGYSNLDEPVRIGQGGSP